MVLVIIKDASFDNGTESFEDWYFPFHSETQALAFKNMLLNDEGLEGLEERNIIFADMDMRSPKYNAEFQFDRFYKKLAEEM